VKSTAREIHESGEDLGMVVRQAPARAVARLSKFPGIGKGSAEEFVEYVATGQVFQHAALMAQVPRGLFAVLEVPGIGPKAARAMWQQLGIEMHRGTDGPDRFRGLRKLAPHV